MKSYNYAEKKLNKMMVKEDFHHHVEAFISSIPAHVSTISEIDAAVLFGSYSRGDYSHRHSDIDLMFFLGTLEKSSVLEEKIQKLILSLALKHHVNAHVLFQYRKIEEEDRSLMLTIAREGKVLFSRKTIVISSTILGLQEHYVIRFDTTGVSPVAKNKLQRFLYGYSMKRRRYAGLVDGEKVLGAGKGAIIVPHDLKEKILLFAHKIGVKAVLGGKVWR